MISVDVRQLRERAGQEIAVSDWTTISQAQINAFAESTGDRQWIHIDRPRAAVESPFKTTIAHGFLTLSLLSSFLRDAVQFTGVRMAINYGLNKVRFVSPVPADSRIRARIGVGAVEEIGGAVQVVWNITVERDQGDRPACVAEWVVRYYLYG